MGKKTVDFSRVMTIETSEAHDVRITMHKMKNLDEASTGIGMIVGGLLREASASNANVTVHGDIQVDDYN